MNVAAWLRGLGLERYEPVFRDNEITAEVLPELTDADLRELGLPLGPRKVVLRAIRALVDSPRPAAPPEPAREEPEPKGPSIPPEAERRQLTVLFCDLVGSTALAAELDPEDLREVIGAYHRCVAAVVERFEGHVAKYMGDGVLAYFGYPRAHEDDAERAVRAALELVAATGRLAPRANLTLQARVGIATGLVVVGDLIGTGEAQERAVVGETPNLVARLQALADPGTVVIAPGTRRLLGGLFDLADLGPQALKGFAAPVRAWAVLGPSAAESRFEARHATGPTPLVGRGEELALLLRRWAQAKEGEGQVVLLAGEAGIGKSRLLRALRERLADEPHTPLSHFCSPYHTNSALYPVMALLERAAGFERDDPPDVKLAKLEALLALGSEYLDEVVPLVAALLGVPIGQKYAPLDLTPQRQKQRTLEVLVDQVAGLAARQPVLAFYEDAHWIDPSTREALGLLIERVQRLPVLVLITFRPEFTPPWTGHAHVTQLSLARLTRRHGAEMALRVTGGKPLPPEVFEQILAKTDGVPLFVEELTKAILESGLLRDAGDRYVLDGPRPPLAIPSSLRDSLMARLDRLAPVKEIAQIAACIGREFGYGLLAAVADRPPREFEAALERLAAAELIFRRGAPPAATYAFKHALVQDAAYQSLLKSKRQQLHARIAEALLTQASEGESVSPEVVAHHFTEASLPERAIVHWLEAGKRANARFAITEAIAHLTRGLDLIDSMPDTLERARRELALLIALGPPQINSKGLYAAEVNRLYARADALAEGVGDRAQRFTVSWGSWNLVQGRADWRSGPGLADKVMALAEGARDPDELIEAHHAKWTTHFFRGELASALPHLAAGRTLYDPKAHRAHSFLYGGHDPGTCCQMFGAMTSALRGYPERAQAEGAAAVHSAHELDNPPNLAYALVFGAHLQQFLRDGPGLLRQAEAGTTLASTLGMTPFVRIGELLQGWAQMECGAIEEGAAQLQRVLARARERRRPAVLVSYYLCLLADSRGRVGDHAEGSAILDAASEMMAMTDERLMEAELHRLRGELLLARSRDQWAEAASCFDRALEVARTQEARLLELRAATSLARLRADQGEHQRACDLLAPVYAWFTEGFDTPDLKDARTLLDELG